MGAKTSVAESCSHFACVIARRLRRSDYEFSGFGCIGLKCVGFLNRDASSTREQRGEGGPSRYTAATKKVCEHSSLGWMVLDWCGNDPSAGSPTETLLRLHLPLNANVWITSQNYVSNEGSVNRGPKTSREHSIGRCDGRCVQRAGT